MELILFQNQNNKINKNKSIELIITNKLINFVREELMFHRN